MSEVKRCDLCACWYRGDEHLGRCRRHAPRIINPSPRGRWPVTTADEGCHEFVPMGSKDQAAAQKREQEVAEDAEARAARMRELGLR